MGEHRAYTTKEMNKYVVEKMKERGVCVVDIAKIVHTIQVQYTPSITVEDCLPHVNDVLNKRETLYALLTGIALDELAEKQLLPEPLQYLIETDEGLFGVDEILTLSIVNMYGSIGLTTFGYLDQNKMGIIHDLDSCKVNSVNTFLDDLVAGVAAAAASKLAHYQRDLTEKEI